MEELAQQVSRLLGQLRLVKRAIHQLNPTVSCALIELERQVPHPQARVAALLDVSLWPAEASHQEVLQPLFRSSQVISWVHRPEDVVGRHLSVKSRNEPGKAVLANLTVNLTF